MNTLAQRLKFILEEKGMSQTEAAKKCGITQQSINYIISNNLCASKLAPQIASSLDVNPEWLIYGKGRLEETKVFEIPILTTPYILMKFINNDLDANSIKYTTIDVDLGGKSFAYLLQPKEMVICTSSNALKNCKYLVLEGDKIKIVDKKENISFSIVEWRNRYAEF